MHQGFFHFAPKNLNYPFLTYILQYFRICNLLGLNQQGICLEYEQ